MSKLQMRFPVVSKHEMRIAKELYQRLDATFDQPHSWCRGWFAEAADGSTCGPNNAKAASFSLDGAVVRAMVDLKQDKVPPRLLDRAVCLVNWTLIQAIWNAGCSIPHLQGPIQIWNDDVCGGREEVRQVVNWGEELLRDLQVRS